MLSADKVRRVYYFNNNIINYILDVFVESLGLLLNADGAPCEGSGKGQTDEGGERSDGNRGGDAGPDGYEIDRLEGGPVG